MPYSKRSHLSGTTDPCFGNELRTILLILPEEIRQLLLNKMPKYGNDDDRADRWAAIADYIGSSYQKDFKTQDTERGPFRVTRSKPEPGYGSAAFGRSVGALRTEGGDQDLRSIMEYPQATGLRGRVQRCHELGR